MYVRERWRGEGQRDGGRAEMLILNNKPFIGACMPLLLQAGLLSSCHWIGHSKVRESADYYFAVSLFFPTPYQKSSFSVF